MSPHSPVEAFAWQFAEPPILRVESRDGWLEPKETASSISDPLAPVNDPHAPPLCPSPSSWHLPCDLRRGSWFRLRSALQTLCYDKATVLAVVSAGAVGA